MQSLYYLACPYSHENPEVREERARKVEQAAIKLFHNNIFVFAPIAYCHPWTNFGVRGDWKTWESFDKTFISRCDGVIVLKLEGWEDSKGVKAEIDFCREISKPVIFLTEEQLNMEDFQEILALDNQETPQEHNYDQVSFEIVNRLFDSNSKL